MANIKKHFGFKVGCGISAAGMGSNGGSQQVQNNSGELLLPGFSKSAFMNEVSSLLDHCGLYVSAMNGFCTSGCSLAKCLVKVFHAVPLYRETASTLLSNWEEIAQTTAAASASVKTEALMQLQDVLTRLEGHSGEDREIELTESVHAVSSCLMAYIELQAQFSYSVFKALGKLSRQQTSPQPSGFLKNSSRAEEAVRKHFAQIINRLTGPSVKAPTSPTTPTSTTSMTSSQQLPSTQPNTSSSPSGSVWPAEIHLAPSSGELSSALPKSSSVSTKDIEDSGLDDVINLLSIGGASAPGGSSSVSSSSSAAAPPKVPPRPDVLSQDAFRVQQQEVLTMRSEPTKTTKVNPRPITTSWSPFAPSQWGNPDWSTEDLSSNWQQRPPGTQSSELESGADWIRWQTNLDSGAAIGVIPGVPGGTKEKTLTWPRPLRERSTTGPWDCSDTDDADEALALENSVRDPGERAKTCTWPLKVDDGAWSMGTPGTMELWDGNETTESGSETFIPTSPMNHFDQDHSSLLWTKQTPSDQRFNLFTPR